MLQTLGSLISALMRGMLFVLQASLELLSLTEMMGDQAGQPASGPHQ
jgi:hypothetical protein